MAIKTGTGVVVEAAAPEVSVGPVERGALRLVKVRQQIWISIHVWVPSDQGCSVCKVVAPTPDEAGAEYLLSHAEAGRICVPQEEGVRPERDQYPVTGWHRIADKLLCGACHESFRRWLDEEKLRSAERRAAERK